MPSNQNPTSICNQALGWVGANLILSLDDQDSTEATLCKANFEPLRDAVLEENEWSFAVRRNKLIPIEDANNDWYPARAFPVPADTVRVLQISTDGRFFQQELSWFVESNMIVVERVEEIYLRSLYRVADTTRFSPMFAQALAARIAAEIATPLTENLEVTEAMYQKYQIYLGNAATTDALQGKNRRIRSHWMRNARAGFGTGGGSIG